jgi:hypothetical protein
MKNPSIKTKIKQHNTGSSKIGSGDYYGTGVKQKIGRPISIMTETPAKKKMGKPPKALA